MFDTLPDGPLKRSQVEHRDRTNAVQGTFAVYSRRDPNAAYGLVIYPNETVRAWVYLDDPGGWIELDATEVGELTGEQRFEDYEIVQEFREDILTKLGAIEL